MEKDDESGPLTTKKLNEFRNFKKLRPTVMEGESVHNINNINKYF